MQTYNKPYPIERILSAASYLTAGLVGFIWWIIAILAKKQVRPFLIYHIMQSIFLSMLFFLISVIARFIMIILLKLPIISFISGTIAYYLITPLPILFNLSITQLISSAIILYLAITSFMGYYSYISWVSDIIKGNGNNNNR